MPSVISLTRVASGLDLVGEADLPADGLAERGVQLLGDALGDRAGGDPAGLGVPDHAADAPAQLQADLRDLRGLAGAGLTGDDHDLVVADRRQDVVLLLADRQLLGVRDRRARAARRARDPLPRPCSTSAAISASTAARASGLRMRRAPSSRRPSRARRAGTARSARAARSAPKAGRTAERGGGEPVRRHTRSRISSPGESLANACWPRGGSSRAAGHVNDEGPDPEIGALVLWLGPGSNRRPIAFQAIARTN